MLNNIKLKNIASFRENTQAITDLNIVNFIFGDNGSGKSTIGRLIKNSEAKGFEECNLEWDAFGKTATLVYNTDFVNETLRETSVKGVFTFGDKAGVKQDELEAKKAEKKQIEDKIQKLIDTKSKELENLALEETRFTDKCWSLQNTYKQWFAPAFKGFNKKDLFKNKCVENINTEPGAGLEELQFQAEGLFSEQPYRTPTLPSIDLADIEEIENADIFRSKIIGKEDVKIAELINVLGNSDWVRQGTVYLNNNVCPFCQQPVPDNLRDDIESYFDETFSKQISELEQSTSRYQSKINGIIDLIESLQENENRFFSFESCRRDLETIREIYNNNTEQLFRKLREPSLIANITTLYEKIESINKLIIDSNESITAFNTKLDNIAQERLALTNKIWKFIGHEISESHNDHIAISKPMLSATHSISNKIEELGKKQSQLSAFIKEIEKDLINTAASKDTINSILKSFGFDNFSLEDAADGYYRIVRGNGEPAQDTLSEGERTFIAFLYFYQIVQGATSKDAVSEPKIVVFDDPVSSLDSKVLFIVSTLIRSLFCSTKMDKLNIKQIIILTHNVYFHKEVSFAGNFKSIAESPLNHRNFSYWIVRKLAGTSLITGYSKNPIKTSYEFLWQEVKRCEKHPEFNIGICNTLRRILENYFKILGGIDLDDLVNSFEGPEKFVVRSLTSWVHDGSHNMHDGIDMGFGVDLTDLYLPVFRKIFEKTKHECHYDMMMQSCNLE